MLRPIVCSVLSIAAVANGAEQPLLTTSGLASGPSEAVLPAGAVLHVRLARPAQSLDALDVLAVSFAP